MSVVEAEVGVMIEAVEGDELLVEDENDKQSAVVVVARTKDGE